MLGQRELGLDVEMTAVAERGGLLAQQMLKDNVIRFEVPSGIATTVLKMLKI